MSRARRVLVLSTAAGGGHVRAAQAIEKAIAAEDGSVVCRRADALDFVPGAVRRVYADAYLALVDRTPELWGYLYAVTEKRRSPAVERIQRAIDRLSTRRLAAFVDAFAPDDVIATHFLPARALAGRRAPRVHVAVTDYDAHAFWIVRGASRTFVATEAMRFDLARRGVPRRRIAVTGIPIDPVFAAPPSRAAARASLGLAAEGGPVILVLSGGFGVGDVATAVRAALRSHPAARVVAVAGRNEALHGKLRAMRAPSGKALLPFGFVRDVERLMGAADVVVTKAGGLTVSEALACSLPIVVTSPIPGQEDRNADFLLESGAAILAKDPGLLEFLLPELLADPARLARMAAAARAAARPDAAARIARAVLSAGR